VDTVDTTGAGDSFVGALLCKIVDDQSVLEVNSANHPSPFRLVIKKAILVLLYLTFVDILTFRMSQG